MNFIALQVCDESKVSHTIWGTSIMKPVKISIAMASFNGERYIKEQLDSFSIQTRLPDELIVSDDCSSDSTLEIVKEFARNAPFDVKIIANDRNVGYVENFSNALDLCSGDIVFLSDQDDCWLPNKLSKVESYLAIHPEILLVAHDIEFCKSDLSPIGQTKLERMRGVFNLEISYVVGMTTAIRGDFLRYCLPIPKSNSITHDKWLHLCANALGKKEILDEVLALHRRHGGNVTSASDNPLNVDFITSSKHFKMRRLALKERMMLIRQNLNSSMEESSLLISWLRKNKDIFIETGYDSAVMLDERIEMLKRRYEAETLRSRILSGKRLNNLRDIIKLYRSGGYAYFNGFKNFVGDLIFRCVFRW